MSKILVFGKYYSPFSGGIESNTKSICDLLAKSHSVTVCASAHEPTPVATVTTETIDGVRVDRHRTWANLKGQPICPSILLSYDLSAYDVIHLHAPNPLVAAMLAVRLTFLRRRPRLVITHHMDIFGRRILRAGANLFYRRLVRMADAVIVTSIKNFLTSEDLPRTAKCHAIPLGVDLAAFSLSEQGEQDAQRWRHALVGDAPVLAFLGRHARYKGLDVLIRALADLPGVHAFIAGTGPYTEPLKRLAAELGVDDRAHFFGHVSHDEKLRLLAGSDALAFPSTENTEAFGVSQLEAMAMRKPLVSVNLPTGVTDVAIEGETAVLAQPGNVQSFVGAVRTLLDDAALRSRLARGAYDRVVKDFELHKVTAAAVRLIEGVGA